MIKNLIIKLGILSSYILTWYGRLVLFVRCFIQGGKKVHLKK